MIGADGIHWMRNRCKELASDPAAHWSNQRVAELIAYIDKIEGELSVERSKVTTIENALSIAEQKIQKLQQNNEELVKGEELLSLRAELDYLKKQLKEIMSPPTDKVQKRYNETPKSKKKNNRVGKQITGISFQDVIDDIEEDNG